jgi:Zn-dependent peptidase ImmA (M78 family)
LGITTRTLSDYENGRSEPQPPILLKIVKELRFPEGFFFLDDVFPIHDDAVSFRSLARMTAKVRDRALAAGEIALELSEWLDSRFETPAVALPDLKDLEPEAAAETLRNQWAFGEKPISNMVHLLEAKGVKVFSLVEDTTDMDAYSFWMAGKPFVFLNTKKTVEHGRFDAAHELGHLVLHKHGAPTGKEAEFQANRFASSLLMTQGSVKARFRRYPTLNKIIKDKSYWMVSAAAYVRRLKDLSLITEWQYRSFSIELSQRGYMKSEPNPIKIRETSKLLPMLFNALREESVTKYDIAKDLMVLPDEIDSLIFNLAMVKLDGGLKGNSERSNNNKDYLRVIK